MSHETTFVQIAELVREKMQNENLLQLSFAVQVAQPTLYQIAKGITKHPRGDIVDKLCQHFGIKLLAVEREAA